MSLPGSTAQTVTETLTWCMTRNGYADEGFCSDPTGHLHYDIGVNDDYRPVMRFYEPGSKVMVEMPPESGKMTQGTLLRYKKQFDSGIEQTPVVVIDWDEQQSVELLGGARQVWLCPEGTEQ